ncbi:hypothetical protein M6B38_402110 [Iris pallida]|uniref:Uncharacterized protein n=1 Tax=Iris pallida TaxID=29817 RepID=A0AAX6FSU8_IRIPA|nr:hypothetical protein M6B38_402110 [Iris pallida]
MTLVYVERLVWPKSIVHQSIRFNYLICMVNYCSCPDAAGSAITVKL